MRCGNCKGSHGSVADVKACYGQAQQEELAMKAELEAERRNEEFWENDPITAHEEEMDRQRTMLTDPINFPDIKGWAEMKGMAAQREREQEERAYKDKMARDEALAAGRVLDQMTGSHGRDMASDKQVRYALDLLAEREWPDTISEEDLRNMERRQVTKLIDGLKAARRKPQDEFRVDVTDTVPAGRYALYHEAGPGYRTGSMAFYQVDRPTEGKWVGRVFVKQLYGAPGEFRKQNLYGMAAARILTKLAEDPQAASLLFGKETATCGVCHSPLTNEESRALGIGPKCRSKMGW